MDKFREDVLSAYYAPTPSTSPDALANQKGASMDDVSTKYTRYKKTFTENNLFHIVLIF